MKRARVIIGAILWTFGVVLLNHFLGGHTVFRYGEAVRTGAPWGVISFPVFIIVHIGWYLLNWINVVDVRDRRPVLLFGNYKGTFGPGVFLLEPLFHTFLDDVSVQDVVWTIKVPNAQTKDNVGVEVEGLVTYRIDANKIKDAIIEVEDVEDGIDERGGSTLVDVIGRSDLDRLLEHREVFCSSIAEEMRKRVGRWGVTVHAFELKKLRITDADVEKAIAMKARAQKEGEAEVTRANMQKQIAAALNEAAATYDEKGTWLKGMETLLELCRSAANNTVLIPTDLTSKLTSLLGRML